MPHLALPLRTIKDIFTAIRGRWLAERLRTGGCQDPSLASSHWLPRQPNLSSHNSTLRKEMLSRADSNFLKLFSYHGCNKLLKGGARPLIL